MSSIHPTAIQYFQARMISHSKVKSCSKETPALDLYRIRRTNGLSDVLVYYSDAYLFTTAELFLLPDEVGRGSFVLLLPHADYEPGVIGAAKKSGIRSE